MELIEFMESRRSDLKHWLLLLFCKSATHLYTVHVRLAFAALIRIAAFEAHAFCCEAQAMAVELYACKQRISESMHELCGKEKLYFKPNILL